MDVLTAAYKAAGTPPTPSEEAGECARCGTSSTQLTRNARRTIVSEQFTAYDAWLNPSGRGLCPPCTWGYTHAPFRERPHLVTAHEVRPLTRPALHDLLTAPLPADVAVIVPLRPGRKYLIPEATWGHVTTDETRLPWTLADTERLIALSRLRAAGFGTRMLTASAPPWAVLRRNPAHTWGDLMADWERLRPWRDRLPWLDLALHATTPPTRSAA